MLLNKDKIQKINLFENLTNSKVKNILDEERLIVIVEHGELGKAIGKKGKNIKMVENIMHKKLKIVEFNDDPIKFVSNFIYPIKVNEITLNDDVIEIKERDRKTKGLLIGRERKNLNELNDLVKNYFNLKIKIL
ncbi:MAG: NusA-like transcription termination signal-binding factor [Nanoarchaeota archaeon]